MRLVARRLLPASSSSIRTSSQVLAAARAVAISRRAAAAATATMAAAGDAPPPPPPPPPLCRVAVAQMTATDDPERNLAVCSSLAEQAARGGARMLFLPECFAFIGQKQSDALAFAQPLSGPLMRRYRSLAKRHGLWVSLGGFQERCPLFGEERDLEEEQAMLRLPLSDDDEAEEEDEGGGEAGGATPPPPPPAQRVYNAHVVVDPLGRVRAVYRKIHLFDVDAPGGGPVLMESRTTMPGEQLVAVPGVSGSGGDAGDDDDGCPCGPLGLTTCYDVRFPEMFAALAFGSEGEEDEGEEGGGGGGGSNTTPRSPRPTRSRRPPCRILCVPSAFTKITGEAHWEVLLRARAIETQCYVIAAAQAGKHSPGRESFGHALIVDPWGDVVARGVGGGGGGEGSEGGDCHATGLAFADLSAERVDEVRRRMPIAMHRTAGKKRWAGGGGGDVKRL